MWFIIPCRQLVEAPVTALDELGAIAADKTGREWRSGTGAQLNAVGAKTGAKGDYNPPQKIGGQFLTWVPGAPEF
ncbi:hypothetical protein [Desulforamulus hydrothermalis]|uniref:hypothetical protein n=1 Tax=Desulforamulus hydrothermalis TaxID=412895 RepID=UPI0002E90877|nr:hypothetical protein [Desulforamulus hydrothermalis]